MYSSWDNVVATVFQRLLVHKRDCRPVALYFPLCIYAFLLFLQVHNHGAYLVDSLWNTTKLLKV